MRKETVSSTVVREGIEALRHMTVGQLKHKYVKSSVKRAGRTTNSFSSGASPGGCKRTRGAASPNARAAAHWRSPMTQTSNSGAQELLESGPGREPHD
jgi:hypothetical protein